MTHIWTVQPEHLPWIAQVPMQPGMTIITDPSSA